MLVTSLSLETFRIQSGLQETSDGSAKPVLIMESETSKGDAFLLEDEKIFHEARKLVDRQDYVRAKEILVSLEPKIKFRPLIGYYLGITNRKLKEPMEAVKAFEAYLSVSSTSKFNDFAEIELAYALCETKNPQAAVQRLLAYKSPHPNFDEGHQKLNVAMGYSARYAAEINFKNGLIPKMQDDYLFALSATPKDFVVAQLFFERTLLEVMKIRAKNRVEARRMLMTLWQGIEKYPLAFPDPQYRAKVDYELRRL